MIFNLQRFTDNEEQQKVVTPTGITTIVLNEGTTLISAPDNVIVKTSEETGKEVKENG